MVPGRHLLDIAEDKTGIDRFSDDLSFIQVFVEWVDLVDNAAECFLDCKVEVMHGLNLHLLKLFLANSPCLTNDENFLPVKSPLAARRELEMPEKLLLSPGLEIRVTGPQPSNRQRVVYGEFFEFERFRQEIYDSKKVISCLLLLLNLIILT